MESNSSSGWFKNILVYLLIIVGLVALVAFLMPREEKAEEIDLSEAIVMVEEGRIKEFTQSTMQIISLVDYDDKKFTTRIPYGGDIFTIFVDLQDKVEIFNAEEVGGINWSTVLLNVVPLLLFGGLIIWFLMRAAGSGNQAMSFGKSKAKMLSPDMPTITFDDVAGVEEAKQEVVEVVEFLKCRDKFTALGARIPKGILLVGPPGTGKTLLAKAIAGEAGAPFYSISGSEFVEMFVGVGASRVRDLFEQAKRTAPAIIFIDEIDAVGRSRGAGLGGGHDEREQTLNQILVEMDGFDTNTSVIVIAATNRPDILDSALLRPGRFDRRVILDNPDINGRKAILKIHSKGKPLAEDVDIENIGKQTVGFSGADLANLMNEAAILAARKNQTQIHGIDFEEAIDRVIAGPARKNRRVNTKEKELTAYHEVGHGLIARMLSHTDPVHKISIVARGMSLGHTRQLPTEDRYMMTKAQFNDTLAVMLGGYTAEQVIYNEISTGASDDIKRATEIARKMVTAYGMSEVMGPRAYGKQEEQVFLGKEIHETRNYGEKAADMIDEEVNKIMEAAHATARRVLTENKDRLIVIASELYIKETLEGKELEELFTRPISAEEVTQAETEMKKHEEEDLKANEKMVKELEEAHKKEKKAAKNFCDTPVDSGESKPQRKFPPKASLEALNEEAKRNEQGKKEDDSPASPPKN